MLFTEECEIEFFQIRCEQIPHPACTVATADASDQESGGGHHGQHETWPVFSKAHGAVA